MYPFPSCNWFSPSNYHLVSLLTFTSKLLEHITYLSSKPSATWLPPHALLQNVRHPNHWSPRCQMQGSFSSTCLLPLILLITLSSSSPCQSLYTYLWLTSSNPMTFQYHLYIDDSQFYLATPGLSHTIQSRTLFGISASLPNHFLKLSMAMMQPLVFSSKPSSPYSYWFTSSLPRCSLSFIY